MDEDKQILDHQFKVGKDHKIKEPDLRAYVCLNCKYEFDVPIV